MVCGFQELTGSLQDLLTQTLEYIKGQETSITALKLAGLSLEGHTQVSVQSQTHEQFLSPFCHDFHEHIVSPSGQLVNMLLSDRILIG